MTDQSGFEQIKNHDDDGNEYWSARDLAELLDYEVWRDFVDVIDAAELACKNSGYSVDDHFAQTSTERDKGYRRFVDYALSRYACYLVVMNANSSKTPVALGQTYFAARARAQEQADEQNLELTEDGQRLKIREQMARHNKGLSSAARSAGIQSGLEFAVFHDHGYHGLYGGLGSRDIHTKKGLKKSQVILDHMGSAELAANLFRVTQTEEKLRREKTQGTAAANKAHFEVGKVVRQTIIKLGNPVPEDLPTPAKSVKQLQSAAKKKPEALIEKEIPVRISVTKASSPGSEVFITCPECSETQMEVGSEECVCCDCGVIFDAHDLAEAVGSATNNCPHCEEDSVVDVDDMFLCIRCAREVVDGDLICSRCSHSVPFCEYDVFDETGYCGYCAHMMEKDD